MFTFFLSHLVQYMQHTKESEVQCFQISVVLCPLPSSWFRGHSHHMTRALCTNTSHPFSMHIQALGITQTRTFNRRLQVQTAISTLRNTVSPLEVKGHRSKPVCCPGFGLWGGSGVHFGTHSSGGIAREQQDWHNL